MKRIANSNQSEQLRDSMRLSQNKNKDELDTILSSISTGDGMLELKI